jgi:iron-sulfur cluster insertion protein
MITITPSAHDQITKLIQEESTPGLRLRLAVTGGGCSGFQYNFSLDSEVLAEDQVFGQAPGEVVIDESSLGLLDGGVVDYVEVLMGASFVIKNPNASSSCGCGNSFSV